MDLDFIELPKLVYGIYFKQIIPVAACSNKKTPES
jgi:hypothetical protein